jgi:hypothetical protein
VLTGGSDSLVFFRLSVWSTSAVDILVDVLTNRLPFMRLFLLLLVNILVLFVWHSLNIFILFG